MTPFSPIVKGPKIPSRFLQHIKYVQSVFPLICFIYTFGGNSLILLLKVIIFVIGPTLLEGLRCFTMKPSVFVSRDLQKFQICNFTSVPSLYMSPLFLFRNVSQPISMFVVRCHLQTLTSCIDNICRPWPHVRCTDAICGPWPHVQMPFSDLDTFFFKYQYKFGSLVGGQLRCLVNLFSYFNMNQSVWQSDMCQLWKKEKNLDNFIGWVLILFIECLTFAAASIVPNISA